MCYKLRIYGPYRRMSAAPPFRHLRRRLPRLWRTPRSAQCGSPSPCVVKFQRKYNALKISTSKHIVCQFGAAVEKPLVEICTWTFQTRLAPFPSGTAAPPLPPRSCRAGEEGGCRRRRRTSSFWPPSGERSYVVASVHPLRKTTRACFVQRSAAKRGPP